MFVHGNHLPTVSSSSLLLHQDARYSRKAQCFVLYIMYSTTAVVCFVCFFFFFFSWFRLRSISSPPMRWTCVCVSFYAVSSKVNTTFCLTFKLLASKKKRRVYMYIILIRSFLLCVCVCLLWKKRYINSSEKTQCVCFRSCAYVLVYAAVGNRLHALQIAAVLTHRSTVVFFIFWVLFFLFLFFFDYGDCCFGRRKTVTVTFYAKICVCVSAFLISGDFSTSFA